MADKSTRNDLLQGTLDLLILETLNLRPLHGWGISKRIQQLSSEVLVIQQGSLYPALYRLQDKGLIRSRWGESEEGRRVRVYRLTQKGKRQLDAEREGWRTMAGAVEAVLRARDLQEA